MRLVILAAALALAAPAWAAAQTPGQIAVLDGGGYARGETAFLYGAIAQTEPGSYLVLQVANPSGDLCRVEQLEPLPGGAFVTGPIPLKGRLCGAAGEYEARLFYGGHSASARLSVGPEAYREPTGAEYLAAAAALAGPAPEGGGAPGYRARVAEAEAAGPEAGLPLLEEAYAAAWAGLGRAGKLASLAPGIRPAAASALDSVAALEGGGHAAPAEARAIEGQVAAAAFRHGIGDRAAAAELMADAFVRIRNADPAKGAGERPPTFAELEASVQALMAKAGSVLGREAREELAFVFSRGTAPLYAGELAGLQSLLTEARYLDVASRKDDPLYRLVRSEWEAEKASLAAAPDVASLLARSEGASRLHGAALLLRELDGVGRFVGDDPSSNSELANLLLPGWRQLRSDLEAATSAGDILAEERRVRDMAAAADISSRISKTVGASRAAGIDEATVGGWEAMLGRARGAGSVAELLGVVSEFDASIAELREGRSPLSVLRFEYESMRPRAQLQADYDSLFRIDSALKVIGIAERAAGGHAPATRIDRIEVLLSSASAAAPEIRARLDSSDGEAQRARAEGILERAKSLENLVELGLAGGRFLPGYADFAGSVDERIDRARALAVAGDLDGADSAVRALFSEWQTVSAAYADDPYGSEGGYSLAELGRIGMRERIAGLDAAAEAFHGPGFAPHAGEYARLAAAARQSVEAGTPAVAEERIAGLGRFLEERLGSPHPRIIYGLEYVPEDGNWLVSGYLDKRSAERQDVTLTVYGADAAEYASLGFSDTRAGEFSTRWHAPTEPGLYVAVLGWDGAEASRAVYVPWPAERQYSGEELGAAAVERELAELESFAEEFAGPGYGARGGPVAAAAAAAREALAAGDADLARSRVAAVQAAIERHLPERSRHAVLDASYSGGTLSVSGAVEKLVEFSEDIYVDVFDQRGDRVLALEMRDSAAGRFGQEVQVPLEPGAYAARLEYHEFSVTDFFLVPG